MPSLSINQELYWQIGKSSKNTEDNQKAQRRKGQTSMGNGPHGPRLETIKTVTRKKAIEGTKNMENT